MVEINVRGRCDQATETVLGARHDKVVRLTAVAVEPFFYASIFLLGGERAAAERIDFHGYDVKAATVEMSHVPGIDR